MELAFFGLFFLNIPAILYLTGILQLFVLRIMAGMFALMTLDTFLALRMIKVKKTRGPGYPGRFISCQ